MSLSASFEKSFSSLRIIAKNFLPATQTSIVVAVSSNFVLETSFFLILRIRNFPNAIEKSYLKLSKVKVKLLLLYSAFTIIQYSRALYNFITPSAQAFFSPFRRILHSVQPYSWCSVA